MSPESRAALETLTREVPALAAACRVHPRATQLGARLSAWARQAGLVNDEHAGEQLHRAGFHALAARAFSEEHESGVLLFAQWLTVLLAHDDRLDDGPAARSPHAVDQTCAEVLTALRDSATTPHTEPVTRAMTQLWQATTPRTSPAWQQRFLDSLTRHWRACRQQAANRHHATRPDPHTFPALRRQASGPYYFDLVEPILGVELPTPLAHSSTWQALVDATGDIVAWCNDLASLDKDLHHADWHNTVLVAEQQLGLDRPAALDRVCQQIRARVTDLQGHARALPAEFHHLELHPVQSRTASKVACVLLGAPRGTIEWHLLSDRYNQSASQPARNPNHTTLEGKVCGTR